MGDILKQIERINYVAGYTINESPKYRPVIDSSSFDQIPEGWNMKEAEVPAPTPTPEPTAAPIPSGSTAPTTPPPAPVAPSPAPSSAPSEAPSNSIAPELPPATPTMDASIGGDMSQSPVQDKDELQKEILRFQLDAMKKMSQKIDQLEGVLSSLNAQQAELHSEVEKVKDPSDVEKFDNRKEDSSPYYFNLNDMWNGNIFQGRMDNFNSKGIIKTKDGYVADFDQLPKLSQYEVKNSFEQI